MHIVNTQNQEKYASKYAVILCREDVDPLKIHELMKVSTYAWWDFRQSNGISRYDWKHFRNWGNDFEEEIEAIKMKKKGKTVKKKQKKFNFHRRTDNFFNLDEDDFYSMGFADAWGTEDHEFFWTQVKGRGGWTPPSSPEPEPEPEKSPEEIAHAEILSKFKTILLDYFMNKNQIVKQLTLFVDSAHIKEISEGAFTIEPDNDWLYILKGRTEEAAESDDKAVKEAETAGEVLGFLIKERSTKAKTLIGGHWHYGAVLQDISSQDCFAFIFGDSYENHDIETHANDIAARNYVWDVTKLLRD